MMFPSHLLATVLVGLIVSRWRPFTRRDWGLAIGFGVLIDLDHLLAFPRFVATHGVTGLTATAMVTWGANWQGFMHNAQFAPFAVLLAALLARTWIPVAFWGLHMFQDFVIATHFVVFGSLEEWLIVASLALAVAAILVFERRERAPHAGLRAYVMGRFGFAQVRPSVRPAVQSPE